MTEVDTLTDQIADLRHRCMQARMVAAEPRAVTELQRAEQELERIVRHLSTSDSPFESSVGQLATRFERVVERVGIHLRLAAATDFVTVDRSPIDVGRPNSDVLGLDGVADIMAHSWRVAADAPSVTDGDGYVYSGGRFVASDSRPPLIPAQGYTDDLVIAADPNGRLRPLWLLPIGVATRLPARLRGTWSGRVALCADVGSLIHVLPTLEPNAFETVVETLPDGLVHDLTGVRFRPEHAALVADESLRRFRRSLQSRGFSAEPQMARSASALSIEELELVDPHPIVRHGESVSVDALGLLPEVSAALVEGGGMRAPYVHQVLATELLRRGIDDDTDLVLSTPTASGKTYAFLPGILDALLRDDERRSAVFLHPLKALSLDQAKKVRAINDRGLGLHVAEFTGSARHDDLTDDSGRDPDVLLATPDKLNYHLDKPGVLAVLQNARFLVLDEAHVYRSYFGANMALFLRRLLQQVPPDLRIVIASATLGNTIEFAQTLTGRKRFRAVGASSAPVHARYHYLVSGENDGGDTPPIDTLTSVLRTLGRAAQRERERGLVFVGRRAETTTIEKALKPLAVSLVSGQKNYRTIIERLQNPGEGPPLVIATNTLEAGIDIGDLSTVAMSGFPRNRNSFRQMAGRAGRTGPAHVVYSPKNDVNDSYYGRIENFGALVRSLDSDPVYLNPANPRLVAVHGLRLQYEAGPAAPQTTAGVVDLLVPAPATPRQRALLVEALDEARSRAGTRAAVPDLRGKPGTRYVVHLLDSPHGPAEPVANFNLEQDSNLAMDGVVEEANARIAHREWAIGNTAARAERYLHAIDWTAGSVTEQWHRSPAVFIWVRDITAHVRTDPEDDPTLPMAAHHTTGVKIEVSLDEVRNSVSLSSLLVATGTGSVSQTLTEKRRRHELRWTFVCPRWRRSRGKAVKGLKRTHRLVDQDSGAILDAGRATPLKRNDAGRGRVRFVSDDGLRVHEGTVISVGKSPDGSVQLFADVHDHAADVPGRCSCGATTEVRRGRKETVEDAPPTWVGHALFQRLHDTIATDVTRLVLEGDGPRALVAVAKAIVKGIPDVLSIDREDIGYVAALLGSSVDLHLFDDLDGGAGLAPRVLDRLLPILSNARRLLAESVTCACGGEGCIGCFESSPTLHTFEAKDHSDEDNDDDHRPWVTSDAAAGVRFLDQMLASEDILGELSGGGVEPRVEGAAIADAVAVPAVDKARAVVAVEAPSVEAHSAPSDVPQELSPTPYFNSLVIDARVFQDVATVGPLETLLRAGPALGIELHLPLDARAPAAFDALPSDLSQRILDVVRRRPAASAQRTDGTGGRHALYISVDREELQGLPVGSDHVYTAVAAWAEGAQELIGLFPDLVLHRPEDLIAVINSPAAFQYPLEQGGRNLKKRSRAPIQHHGPPPVHVLSRYDAVPRRGRSTSGRIGTASDFVDALLRAGTSARHIAEYLTHWWPGLPVAIVPPATNGKVRQSLATVIDALRYIGHPTVDASTVGTGPLLLLGGVLGGVADPQEVAAQLGERGIYVVTVALGAKVPSAHQPDTSDEETMYA